MTAVRMIDVHDKGYDGTHVYAEWWAWESIRDEPKQDDYVVIRTTGGRPVHVHMRDARALGSWLLEHSADVPQTVCGHTSPGGLVCIAAIGTPHEKHMDGSGYSWMSDTPR